MCFPHTVEVAGLCIPLTISELTLYGITNEHNRTLSIIVATTTASSEEIRTAHTTPNVRVVVRLYSFIIPYNVWPDIVSSVDSNV